MSARDQSERGVVLVSDLGSIAYTPALELQRLLLDEVIAHRDAPTDTVGRILLLEHKPPVITVSRRDSALSHLVTPRATLEHEGIEVQETDRGGDITYHGPGQLVVYPILDLNRLGLNLHAYMRLLEAVVIQVCAALGVSAERDSDATGVWIPDAELGKSAKICAIGVRVRRWVTMHGLALNVTTNLDHFKHIVPCGLIGRPVTSLRKVLGDQCPSMDHVKDAVARQFAAEIKCRAVITPGEDLRERHR